MDEILKSFLSPSVVVYMLGVLSVPFLAPLLTRMRANKIAEKRKAVGLDERVLSNPGDGLAKQRKESLTETMIVFAVVILLPLVIILALKGLQIKNLNQEIANLKIAFGTFLLWTLVSGTSVAKNFLGGLAFRCLAACSNAIQVGDRVTVLDHHGVVKEIGIFFTKIQTLEDDQVSIPSAKLLDEVLISTNAGERASMVSLPFYLHPTTTSKQTEMAEKIIWDTIQSATLFDPAHPLKIMLAQTNNSLVLTAKCHVTSTYSEAEFRSEVTKQTLKAFGEKDFRLGNPGT